MGRSGDPADAGGDDNSNDSGRDGGGSDGGGRDGGGSDGGSSGGGGSNGGGGGDGRDGWGSDCSGKDGICGIGGGNAETRERTGTSFRLEDGEARNAQGGLYSIGIGTAGSGTGRNGEASALKFVLATAGLVFDSSSFDKVLVVPTFLPGCIGERGFKVCCGKSNFACFGTSFRRKWNVSTYWRKISCSDSFMDRAC